MSSAEEGQLPERRRTPSAPRPIDPSDSEGDDYDAPDNAWFAASPGASSDVEGSQSWRPVPPPMLASSLDIITRFRPSLNARPPSDSPASAATSTTTSRSSSSQALTSLPSASSHPEYGTTNGSAALPLPYDPSVQAPNTVTPQSPALLQMQRQRVRSRRPRPRPYDAPPIRSTSIRAKLARCFVQIRQLKDAPRELWIIFAIKFLSSYAYFSLSLVLTMFLTDEFGMSDTAAGWAYGVYGVMSTFFGLLCGWFIDYMGVRASLMVGALVGAVSRFVVAVTLSRRTAVFMLFTLLPFAECLGIPIMTIGIKRYTNARNRTFAFSLFYSVMNIAALCAGPLVDASRRLFGDGIRIDIHPLGSVHFTALRLVILSGALATAAMFFVIAAGIREVEVDESGAVTEFTPNRDSPVEQTRAVLRDPAFWRLTVFTLLLVGVRLVFRHVDATMPKYMVRQFGPDAPYGLVYAINPFLIIFLVPIVGLMTRKVDSFSMILSGSFVSAASPFWVCFKQTYLSIIMFMVTLSIGEAIYSPRVYEYTMEVSAHGAEGLYSSLSTAPLFSVKLLVGGMSGWLLTSFMPADGPHHGAVLWGIIGLTSMTSPILMFLLREYISPSPVDAAERTQLLGTGDSNVVGKEAAVEEVLVSAARPPTGRAAAIAVNLEDTDYNNDTDSDDERRSLASCSASSPLSLPPLAGPLKPL